MDWQPEVLTPRQGLHLPLMPPLLFLMVIIYTFFLIIQRTLGDPEILVLLGGLQKLYSPQWALASPSMKWRPCLLTTSLFPFSRVHTL